MLKKITCRFYRYIYTVDIFNVNIKRKITFPTGYLNYMVNGMITK